MKGPAALRARIASGRARIVASSSPLSRPVRLALGLVMLLSSVLFVSDVLGLRPDPGETVRESRKSVAEALAVQLSALASLDDAGAIEYAVSAFVLRSADVRAAELVRTNGIVLARHGDPDALADVADASTATHLSVPILEGVSPWGELRIVFVRVRDGGRELAWFGFVALVSFGSFALFLSRVLVQLDPGRVVPGRVDSAFDLFSAGVVILDVEGRIVMVNRAARALVGRDVAALLGRVLDDWPWSDEGETAHGRGTGDADERPWTAALASGRPEPDRRLRLQGEDGVVRPLSVSCAPVGGGAEELHGLLVTLDDETRIERQNVELGRMLVEARRLRDEVDAKNAELVVLATTDPLTGLANRRTLVERLEAAFEASRRDGTALSCFMCDVDHFKRVNDTHGHAVGDEVIRAVAGALERACGDGLTVGRYGGEEFVAVLPGLDATAATALAERVRIAVMALGRSEALPVDALSASFGVAAVASASTNGMAIVDAADGALYVAKREGRNRVEIAGEERAAPSLPGGAIVVPDETGDETRVGSFGAMQAPVAVPAADLSRVRVVELEAELAARANELAALREFDALTGVPMRTLFLQRTTTELARAGRTDTRVAMLSLELRELDRIVSTFGHVASDALVVEFVERLETGLRTTDLVSPISGEHSVSRITTNEYGVLLCELADAAGALIVVTRLRRLLGRPFRVAGQKVYLGANIGIAVSSPGADASELLGQAGDARAAAAGRPDKVSHAFASTSLDARANDYIRLESDLHDALDGGALEVWFQPKFDLASRTVTGLEALLRWRHPTRGFVSPAVFVAVAEANGLIGRLSDFVLSTTLSRIVLWRSMGFDELRVSVNVSPMQLRAESLVDDVLEALDRAGVAGRQLEIELTETSVFERPEEARVALEALRAADVGISMDDFGTGYTSLSLLAQLPLDTVKIDRSFVVAMGESERSRAIVASVVTMAHALGLRVVGEGIETQAQFDALEALGCDEIQGYLISRPLPMDEITAFLVHSRDEARRRSA